MVYVSKNSAIELQINLYKRRRFNLNRVLFIINSFVGGGAERVVYNLIEHFSNEVDVDVVTLYCDQEDNYRLPKNVKIFNLGIDSRDNLLKKAARLSQALFRLNKFITEREAESEYKLITSHLSMAHLLTSISHVSKRCIYVHHALVDSIEKGPFGLSHVLFSRMYSDKGIIAVSEGVKEQLVRTYGLNESNLRVVYNAVPYARIARDAEKAVTLKRPYILFVGRLTTVKRPEFMLKIFLEGRFYEKYDLVYLGKGPLESHIRSLVKDNGLQDCVHLEGFQDNPFSWMAGSSALVMTSEVEALPTVLVEGLFSGAKVISGDCDYGPREILTGQFSRFLVNKDDIYEYINAINNALSSYPALTNEFIERYDEARVAEKYLSFYQSWNRK